MAKLISTIATLILLTEVYSRTPGWFYSVRGGTGLLPNTYPDALTSVVHGCAELDKETDAEQVRHLKASGPTKKVVKTVSSKNSHERVDNEMFEKLNDKLFHHHDHVEAKTEGAAKISYGAREFLLDGDME